MAAGRDGALLTPRHGDLVDDAVFVLFIANIKQKITEEP
jgi:hypothetical protein